MTTDWLAIEEPVPQADEAIAVHAAAGSRAPQRSRLVESLAAVLNEHRGECLWLIAPSRRVGRQWLDTLARTGMPVFGVRPTTLRALAFDLAAAELTAAGLAVASQRASLVLLETVLRRAATEGALRAFTAIPSEGRLAERMLPSLVAIRMAGLDAEAVRRRKPFGATPKGHDIATLLDRYAAALADENLVDAADVIRTAIRAAKQNRLPESFERLLLPAETDLKRLDRLLLDCLGSRLIQLSIDAPPADQTSLTSSRTFSFFRGIGAVNEIRGIFRRCLAQGIRLDEVELLHSDSTSYPLLVHEVLAVAASTAGHSAAADDLPVTFAEGLPIRESRPARALAGWLAWRAAGHPPWQLVQLLRDGLLAWRAIAKQPAPINVEQSLPPHDAATGNPENPRRFQGLPTWKKAMDGFFHDQPVTQAGLVRELRQLQLGFRVAEVASRVQEVLREVERAELATFAGHRRDADDEPEVDQALARRRREERLARLQVLAELATRLADCELSPALTASEVLTRARVFLETLAVSSGQFDNNAKNRLVAEISEMEHWVGRHPGATASEMLDWLASLTDELVVMGSGPRPGCLHVAPLSSGGHTGRPVSFLVGLDEGRLPGPAVTDPVLPDADREAISADLERSSQISERVREQFMQLLGRLRGEVVLSYACTDLSEQAEAFPSPLLLEVFRQATGSPAATMNEFLAALDDETESFVPRRAEESLHPSEWWLTRLGADPALAAVEQAARHHSDALARGFAAEEARRSAAFTPFDGNVVAAGPELDPANPQGRVASAHSLEALGTCPRRFFFKYGLGVKPLEELEPEADRWLDPLDHGSVMHAVLERFMQQFVQPVPGRPAATAPAPNFAEHRDELLAILDDILASKRAEKPTDDQVAFEARRRELAEAALTFLRSEEEYCRTTGSRPVALEAAIGITGEAAEGPFTTTQPATLTLASGRCIRLRGIVDRIDIDGRANADHAYTIIDYKSGSSARFKKGGEDPLKLFDQGRRLQHGLYTLMVRHVAQRALAETSEVTRFAYVFPGAVSRGERVEWDADQLALVDGLVDRLCSIAAAGAFLPTADKNDCTFCDFTDVCGDAETTAQASRRKLAATPELAELFSEVWTARRPSRSGTVLRRDPPPLAATALQTPGPLDDAAARAAIRTELGTSMIVEASAGTGKTTCMVDRLVSLVQTGTATVSQLVAITFTKKSAAELARRFRERLERAVTDPSMPPPERERLTKALAQIDAAVIGTVHAFCGRLLRERPIEAGLDPALEMLDPGGEELLRERAWRQFGELVAQDATLAAHRQALEAAGVELRDLRSAFATFVAQGDVRQWPHEAVAPPDVGPLLSRTCEEIAVELDRATVPWQQRGSDALMDKLEGILRAYRHRHDDTSVSLMQVAEAFEGACPKLTQSLWLPDGKRDQQKANKERLEEWWDRLVTAFAEPLRQWRAYRYHHVIPLLEAARDHYEQLRLAEGRLSFQDLLCRAAALLRDRPDIRCDFADRHRFLLVDEFQDTDPIQAELLLLLTAADPKATDWRTTTIKPGSLFVVGDPKQSIYRFRRADIGTFEFVRDRIEASGGKRVSLTTNFRTTAELVEWVNDMFPRPFAAHADQSEDAAYGPGFTASHVGRADATGGVLVGLRQLRLKSADPIVEAEAVARFIRRSIDQGLTVPRSQSELERGVGPACRPEDFLIVTWDTGELATFARAMNAVGLPCDVTGQKGADAADDLAMLQLVLRVVADPDDTVAALGVLRGPVFGFPDTDLRAFHKAGGTISGRLAVPESLSDADLRQRLAAAGDAFKRWRRLAASLPLAAAIERIADDAGLFLIASAAGGRAGRRGRAAAGVLATLIERIRAERSLVTSVPDAIDRIDDLLAKTFPKRDFDTLPLDAAVGGAVRVMNLHKVKGLEAPVVFLCDRDGPQQSRDRGASCHIARTSNEPIGSFAVKRPRNSFGTSFTTLAAPLDWHEQEATEQRYLEAEYLRLNYVAGTRPGACLVVSVYEDSKGTVTGGWHELAPGITAVADLPELPESAADEPVAAGLLATDEVAAAQAELQTRLAGLRRASYGTVTPRDFLTEPAERIRHTGRGLGQDWGTVIHRLLELAVASARGNTSALDLEAAATSAIAETDLLQSGHDQQLLITRAVELVQEVMQHPVWRRIVAGAQCHVELPFTISVPAAEITAEVEVDYGPVPETLDAMKAARIGTAPAQAATTVVTEKPPVLIRGQIDLVYQDPDTAPNAGMTDWLVLDWKTTSVADSEIGKLEDHYRPQLRLYARCWAAWLAQE